MITYNDIYSNSWVESRLTNKQVIGWDYNHGFEEEDSKSVREILEDAKKVIDYLKNTYKEY